MRPAPRDQRQPADRPFSGSRMGELTGVRAALVGAGAAGLCLGLELLERGARVLLIDPGDGAGASAVAAGMLAPAMEAATDPQAAGRFLLFKAGRDLWPEFAGGVVPIHREGALWIGPRDRDGAEVAAVAAALEAAGARHEPASPELLSGAAPGLIGREAVYTPEDWRLEPAPALRVMSELFGARGGAWRRASVQQVTPGAVELGDGSSVQADLVAACAGWGARALSEAAPELTVLAPIRGELIRFTGAGPFAGPTVRTRDGYLVPGSGGVIVGATMAEGEARARLTPEVQARFRDLGRRVFPTLANAGVEGAAGVRAATPDGLPLVGRSARGVWLCTGFRRNGWLLAPLAARIATELMAGRDPGPWAAALRPDRFVSSGGR